MKALFLKEVSGYFASLSGWVVIVIYLLLNSLFLWIVPGAGNIPESGYAQMDGLFTLSPWIFLFLVPAVNMRMFSEEYHSGTFELLLTRPLAVCQIVVAKYLASLLLIVIAMVPTIVFFISIVLLRAEGGYVDTGAIYGSYIGLVFLASAYTSLSLLASSLTNNSIVAFFARSHPVRCLLYRP